MYFENSQGDYGKDISQYLSKVGWTKFTIEKSLVEGLKYVLYLYVNNNLQTPITKFVHLNKNFLTHIVFCHQNPNCLSAGLINWSAGYYKNLKIWNQADIKTDSNNGKNLIRNFVGVYENLYLIVLLILIFIFTNLVLLTKLTNLELHNQIHIQLSLFNFH